MRPAVKRRLLTLAAAGSMLLCAATIALWWRSYQRCDSVYYYRVYGANGRSHRIHNQRGTLVLVVASGKATRPNDGSRVDREWSYDAHDASPPLLWEMRDPFTPPHITSSGWFLGFGWYLVTEWGAGETFDAVAVPHWFLALLAAIIPALRLRAELRSHRQRRIGRCRQCGYDLRATSDRCPECGAVPASARGRGAGSMWSVKLRSLPAL
jgi:hypothetical protein